MKVAPPKSRVEIQSNGFDPTAQFIGTDPYNGGASLGLKVPTLATVSLPSATPKNTGAQSRYLFALASFKVGASGGCARIKGYRLLVQLWAEQTSDTGNRFVRQTVYDPSFTLSDANWSWHLRYIPTTAEESLRQGAGVAKPVNQNDGTVVNLDGTAYRWTDTSSLLYETMLVAAGDPGYIDLLDYVPPAQGRPPGEPLANLGTFYGVSTPWDDSHAWDSLDIPCSSPGIYALFASVRQTNTSTRIALSPPSTFFPNGLSAEEQFLLNFPNAYIGAVGGSLIVEYESDECDSDGGFFGASGGPCG
jgi:hypothetical protein